MIVVCFFLALCASMDTEQPGDIDIELVTVGGNTLVAFQLNKTTEEDVKAKVQARVDELNLSADTAATYLLGPEVDIMKGGTFPVVYSPIQRVANRRGNAMCKLAFTAVHCTGDPRHGGDTGDKQEELNSGVESIVATENAFAALKEDGKVVAWGNARHGGDTGDKQEELNSGVESIVATDVAFAALKQEGKVVAWGDGRFGGDTGDKQQELNSGVKSIVAANYAFAALKEDGKVVAWGDAEYGGDTGDRQQELNSGVESIVAADYEFAALKEDGKVVAWGDDAEDTGDEVIQSHKPLKSKA